MIYLPGKTQKLEIKSFGQNVQKMFLHENMGLNSAVIQLNDGVSAISNVVIFL